MSLTANSAVPELTTATGLKSADSDSAAAPDAAHAALVLYARMLGASTVSAAAHDLLAALVQQFGCTRATIGWHQGGRTRVLASSNIDHSNDQAELSQALVGAMDEAIDQGVALAWPPHAAVDGSEPDWIMLEHQVLQRLVGAAVATVPLGVGGEAFGAVCVESPMATPIDAATLRRLELLLVLAAPALRWMQRATEPWHRRARRAVGHGLAALRQPSRRGRRRLLVAAALGLLFLAVTPLERNVGGRARIEGAQQRVLSAPTDGFVKTAHVRPGDRVLAGAPLVDLVEGDLLLERERWSSQLAQHENAYAGAMAKSERANASTSLARIAEAQAQLALVSDQLARGRLTAPFDALVVQGDLSQSIGAPVRQGDALLTLATTERYRVIVEIDEVDIARVRAGQAGRLVLSSLPWDTQQLVVERMTPLARAVDGRNVFDVEARLANTQDGLRPGLLGRADLVVGHMPPLWAWTLHALERMRVAYWVWLG